MCGFTVKVVNILNNTGVEYDSFNVLEDDEMREAIKQFTDWPTLPQIFINGEFIGGADILEQLEESGDLKKMLA